MAPQAPEKDDITFRVCGSGSSRMNSTPTETGGLPTDRERQGYIEGRLTGNIANTRPLLGGQSTGPDHLL